MYYYKLSNGTVIDVEKIVSIEDNNVGGTDKRISMANGEEIILNVKNRQLRNDPPIESAVNDIKNIENIMQLLTMKNVSRTYIQAINSEPEVTPIDISDKELEEELHNHCDELSKSWDEAYVKSDYGRRQGWDGSFG